MTILKKCAVLGLVLAMAACTNPNRFGGGGEDGVGLGAAGGLSADGGVGVAALDPASPAFFSQTVGDRVLFAVDQSTLTPAAQQTLTAQAAWLGRNPDFRAIIEGHADEQGTREYNLALGNRRANAVREFLVSQGVDPSRMQVVSFGKERPAELCAAESCYSQNRRAVTVIAAAGLS